MIIMREGGIAHSLKMFKTEYISAFKRHLMPYGNIRVV